MLLNDVLKKIIALEKEMENVISSMINIKDAMEITEDTEMFELYKDKYKLYGRQMVDLGERIDVLKANKHYVKSKKDRTFME